MITDHDFYHRVILFLYRYWFQKYFDEIPIFCNLTFSDDLVECQRFVLYFSLSTISDEKYREMHNKIKKEIYYIAPNFPTLAKGYRIESGQLINPTDILRKTTELIERAKKSLCKLESGHVAPIRNESWHTLDYGKFRRWKGRSMRLILYPEYPTNETRYGYTYVRETDEDGYVMKSRSCKEEGPLLREGKYKRSKHKVKRDEVDNVDLIYLDGNVELLRFKPAGAGYKVFKRRVPDI